MNSIKKQASKRVEIVHLKMVRESSLLYEPRRTTQPQNAVHLLHSFLVDADREQFIALCLNTKNEPTVIQTVSIGSLDSTIIHPREVFKIAVLSNAASLIVAHNHPSGDTTPSKEDLKVTKTLRDAGELLGIPLLDHLIIGGNNQFCSIKKRILGTTLLKGCEKK